MRRPVKPFVTEYKASNRRNPGAPGEQGVFESERPAAKPFDFMMRAEADESYDSAMRAADALFSIPQETKHAAEPASHAEGDSQPLFDASQPRTSPQEKGVGRILRVLDEDIEPEYAAQEAEHAPKRRGRKPGSKNKPKVQAVTGHAQELDINEPDVNEPDVNEADMDAEVADPIVTAPAIPAARKIPALTAAPVAARGLAQNGFANIGLAQSRILAMGATANGAATDGIRGDKRFPWVRDRLKPGEDWKRRRLPRICW